MRIDAHQHYWEPKRGDYDWMPPDDPVLSRRYGPADLNHQLEAAGIEGTVLVQAAATINETEYMLGLADATDTILGVVGWVNFEDRGDLKHLERLAKHPKFLGVRPMIQDIPDVDWMLRDDIQWAFEALIDLDLTFDALGFPKHLENFRTILTRYPKLRAVIDHCMKPEIRDGEFGVWAAGIERIAKETEAMCKFSGLVTEAADHWTVEQLKPYADHVLSVFGPTRVMWGSDWPVCLLRTEYGQWLSSAQTLTEHLSSEERDAIFGGTARRFYRLKPPKPDE
ncbi:MAG: amidohydrolase family protein [Pseudomonadota bacterium]